MSTGLVSLTKNFYTFPVGQLEEKIVVHDKNIQVFIQMSPNVL